MQKLDRILSTQSRSQTKLNHPIQVQEITSVMLFKKFLTFVGIDGIERLCGPLWGCIHHLEVISPYEGHVLPLFSNCCLWEGHVNFLEGTYLFGNHLDEHWAVIHLLGILFKLFHLPGVSNINSRKQKKVVTTIQYFLLLVIPTDKFMSLQREISLVNVRINFPTAYSVYI